MTKSKKVRTSKLLIVNPFSSEIIGADGKYVYVKEIDMTTSDKEDWCVFKIKISKFIKIVREWINSKSDFCNRYGHFCGVFGDFGVEEYKEKGKINILVGIDEETEELIYKNVPLYEVILFEESCDMEHG